MARSLVRTEFAAAVTQVAAEHGIDPEVVLDSIKEAIVAAYHREAREQKMVLGEEENYQTELDPQSGEARIYRLKGKKKEDVTPAGFGRIAALTAKQVILQKIREAEKSAVLTEYEKRTGSLVTGLILRFDNKNVIVDIGKTEGVMPPEEQIPPERYRPNQRLCFYLKEIRQGPKGSQIILSRADKGLVENLFSREVPEVANGSVEIKVVAREPGERIKIAVFSNRPGVDPVGSCVGQKGVRVQAVIAELQGEKIDVIQYNEDPEKFILAALAPAEDLEITVLKTKKEARVIAPDDQLSLAIGRDGQNVRLASRLTGYKIDIKGKTKKKKSSAKKPAR